MDKRQRIERLAIGLQLLRPYAAGTDPVAALISDGIGVDCVVVPDAVESVLESIGWTWDRDTHEGSPPDAVCWKFSFR